MSTRRGSRNDRIVKMLRASPRPLTTREIADGIGRDVAIGHVQWSLFDLRRRRVIEQAGRAPRLGKPALQNLWRAVERDSGGRASEAQSEGAKAAALLVAPAPRPRSGDGIGAPGAPPRVAPAPAAPKLALVPAHVPARMLPVLPTRRDDCIHASACLGAFVRRYPTASGARCPDACPEYDGQPERATDYLRSAE